MNNICLVITLIISIQYVDQTYGSCDRFTNNYVFCRINGVPYDKGNLIYAFEPETFPIILELPRLTRDTTDATGTCSRIFVNGTETKCSDKDCTLPICLFQIYDPEPAERVFINAVSNDLSCQPMNFTFYVNGITLLAPIYAIEGVDVIFQWMYPFEVDGIKWFRGGENGELLMTYIPGNGEPATEEGFHVNYINEPNSVGMVLPNVTMAATANYTVLVNITDNILDKTTTTLTIITANAYETFMNRTSIVINGMPPVYYGQPIGAVDSGNISIETNVPDDYGEITSTVCTRHSPSGEDATCGNCSDINCVFIVTDAAPGDAIMISIQMASLQGGPSINFAVYAKGISQISNITAVEGCEVELAWTYPNQFKKVEWFAGGVSDTPILTHGVHSENATSHENSTAELIHGNGSIGIVIRAAVDIEFYRVRVQLTELAFEEATVHVKVITKGEYEAYQANTSLTVNGDRTFTFGEQIALLDPGNVNFTLRIPNDFGQTNATCWHDTRDGMSTNCGVCNNTICEFQVDDAQLADRIKIIIVSEDILCSGFNFTLAVRGITPIDQVRALDGCDVVIPWTYPMPFERAEWFADLSMDTKMLTYSPADDVATVEDGFNVSYHEASNSIGIIMFDVEQTINITVRVTITSFTVETSSTSVLIEDGRAYRDGSSLTVNSAKEIQFSSSGLNVVDEEPLLISTNISGLSDVTVMCTVVPLNGNFSSCGNCTDGTTCDFNITDVNKADKIALSVEQLDIQCSLMEQDLLVTSISPILPFYAIEHNDVEIRWTVPFNATKVFWYRGDIHDDLIMTFPRADRKTVNNTENNTDTESSTDVRYIDEYNSVGILLMNASTQASGTYSVLVVIGDHGKDYASTNVTIITESSYEDFKRRMSISVGNSGLIAYGHEVSAIDSGDLIITTNIPDDYGKSTRTVCTVASPQGEIDQCGLCTGLTCEFNVTDTSAGDLIRVNIEIDLLQGSSLEFSVGVKAITPLTNIYVVEGGDVTIPWTYPTEFKKVEWFEGNSENGSLMLTYLPESNSFIQNTRYQVTYINATGSIGIIVQNVKATYQHFTVRVMVTEFVTEEANVDINIVLAKDYDSYKEHTMLAFDSVRLTYIDDIPVVDPGSLSITYEVPGTFSPSITTCNLQTPTGSNTSCGVCQNIECSFTVNETGEADVITLGTSIQTLQSSYFSYVLFIRGINQLDDIKAVEGCDTLFGWTYPSAYVNAEWFKGSNSDGILLMNYTSETNETYVQEGQNIRRHVEQGSIGMVLLDATEGGYYTVKLTLSEKTSEESKAKLDIIQSTDYTDYKKNATIKVNNGQVKHYGDAIDEVEAGDVNIEVTIPDTYGSASITCTRIKASGGTISCGHARGVSFPVVVSGVNGKDSIDIEVAVTDIRCASPFTFTVKVKETVRTAGGTKMAASLITLTFVSVVAAWITR